MTEQLCTACSKGRMHRSERRGLWEKYVLPLMGQYPWRCGFCRTRVSLKNRGPDRQYLPAKQKQAESTPKAF